jgi:hypothetical protein
MANLVPALVALLAATVRAVILVRESLPHIALASLAAAIVAHWFGLDGPSQVAGVGAFFTLALAVVLRRELV